MKQGPVQNSNKISVTFEMPADIQAATLSLVGDFNDWDPAAAPMRRRKDGTWAKTLRLAPGIYHYRFVTDDGIWYNDPAASGYEPSGLGEDNSVVIVGA